MSKKCLKDNQNITLDLFLNAIDLKDDDQNDQNIKEFDASVLSVLDEDGFLLYL
jgi:hypothetical protein